MKKIILILFLFVSAISFAGAYYTKTDYVYTVHANHLDELIQVVSNGDKKMFSKMMKALQLPGSGGFLTGGRQVYITNRGYGTIQFYFAGESQRYWTIEEAIEYRN